MRIKTLEMDAVVIPQGCISWDEVKLRKVRVRLPREGLRTIANCLMMETSCGICDQGLACIVNSGRVCARINSEGLGFGPLHKNGRGIMEYSYQAYFNDQIFTWANIKPSVRINFLDLHGPVVLFCVNSVKRHELEFDRLDRYAIKKNLKLIGNLKNTLPSSKFSAHMGQREQLTHGDIRARAQALAFEAGVAPYTNANNRIWGKYNG